MTQEDLIPQEDTIKNAIYNHTCNAKPLEPLI